MNGSNGNGDRTISDALATARSRLKSARVPEAELKAEWSLADLLGGSRADLLLRMRDPCPPSLRPLWNRQVARMARHEPLQYVLGNTEFHGRLFFCDRRALIPRPETELLVDHALILARARRGGRIRIADVGTGTGCIALTLALELPGARVLASDLSSRALALARRNARHLRAVSRVRFARRNLLDGLPSAAFHLIVSNPPYVRESEWPRLDRQIHRFEPRTAFDGGADGLDVIRRLIRQSRICLRPGGHLLLEIGESQGTRVKHCLRSAGFDRVTLVRDWAGHPRILSARAP